MKVFVTGATGVLGRAALASLCTDGHTVAGIARDASKAALLDAAGVRPVLVGLFDPAALTEALRGFDAVCNLATHIPVGLAALRSASWRTNDRVRIEGSRVVIQAARAAGVRRVVQESVSFLYADGGDDWIAESSVLAVTRAIEPSAVAESQVADFGCASRESVVLRFGNLIGDDDMTRWRLGQASAGRPIGLGDPRGWAHIVHPSDAGAAVAAALTAPGGVYNVGAEPVRRDELTAGFAEAVGRDRVGFLPKLVVKMAGERLEPLTRSHRVTSDRMHEATGWKPRFDTFDAAWLSGVTARR